MSGVPVRPVASPVTLPVIFPLKVVAVITPVITAPSGNTGALPFCLPLILVALSVDIRDLRFAERR